MASETIITCDVEGCTNTGANPVIPTVVFITEQTEGRSIDPKLDEVRLDMCDECRKYSLENREMLTAAGAMGNNRYWFKSKKS